MLTYESFTPGAIATFGHTLVTREAILEFAREFDPQPFHLDETAATATMLGGLSASGWHTAGMMMAMNARGWLNGSASWGAPGLAEVKWLKPVRAGDVLSVRSHLLAKRLSKSRPEMGLLDWHFDLINQLGEVVMTQDNTIMMGLAGKSPPRTMVPSRAAVPEATPAAAGSLPGWYEDAEPGAVTRLGSYRFEREAMIRFAEKFDPQPFHLDEAAAAKSHFGALAASGWQTASAFMLLLVQARQRRDAGEADVPPPGPSHGFTNMRWLRPVHAGDRLDYSTEITGKRPVARPGWGLVQFCNWANNGWGERVFEFEGAVFGPMRQVTKG